MSLYLSLIADILPYLRAPKGKENLMVSVNKSFPAQTALRREIIKTVEKYLGHMLVQENR